MAILKAGSTNLPSPVFISTADEVIWSATTGRSASGKMIGDVVANKKTINIKWEMLTESDVKIIKDNLTSGFFPLTFRDDNANITITMYRGTLTKEHLGALSDGYYYYKSVEVTIIQQ